MNIAFFDFDGTITTKDTLFQFIRFSKGDIRFYSGIFLLTPVFLLFKLGLLPNWRAKEMVFSWFFRGESVSKFRQFGKNFSDEIIPRLIRPEAKSTLNFHRENKDQIVVVTASFSSWIKPWCETNHIELIATECEIKKGKLTGLIDGNNCFGSEKVRRILEKFDLSAFDKIYAYGDSKADMEMLNLADEKFLRWEKIK